jgi:hypothetical protein
LLEPLQLGNVFAVGTADPAVAFASTVLAAVGAKEIVGFEATAPPPARPAPAVIVFDPVVPAPAATAALNVHL